jgi:hypothetical protein
MPSGSLGMYQPSKYNQSFRPHRKCVSFFIIQRLRFLAETWLLDPLSMKR